MLESQTILVTPEMHVRTHSSAKLKLHYSTTNSLKLPAHKSTYVSETKITTNAQQPYKTWHLLQLNYAGALPGVQKLGG